MSTSSTPRAFAPIPIEQVRLAVLHQGAPAPAVGGVVKPAKPGGYTDSSSDIAHALSPHCTVLTPTPSPSPSSDDGWSFPDTVPGILSALRAGANVLYANTVVHSSHPFLTPEGRERLTRDKVRIVGQNVHDTQRVDDKAATNAWLVEQTGLEGWFPRAVTVGSVDELKQAGWTEGGVAKPIRGRGSHGVKLCRTKEELERHVEVLLKESDKVLIEEILGGEEATVAVLPPGTYTGIGTTSTHLALNPVSRFNHQDGIAPYSGSVPVTVNSAPFPLAGKTASGAPPSSSNPEDWRFPELRRACEQVADKLQTLAVLRIDCRRRTKATDNRRVRAEESDGDGGEGEWVLFDVNMKPNITGPGRPGRDQQTSLVGLAARVAGWEYPELLQNLVCNAKPAEWVLEEGRLDYPLS